MPSAAAVGDKYTIDYSDRIRSITDEEVATFWEQGWVFVPEFVDRALCEEIIQHYCDWSGLERDWPSDPAGQQRYIEKVNQFTSKPGGQMAIRQSDPWMFNYVTQRKFGEAAARLLKVPSIRPLSETLHIKYPVSSGHSRPLGWHQDFPSIPSDRAEAAQFWLALVPITPDMGPMVHLNGSHRSMPGGIVGETEEDATQLYPELFEQYQCSEPGEYKAGDALFHHSLTWHRSGANQTDKVRWAMSSYRLSTRCRYTGQVNFNTDGLGLIPREPFDHPNFPIVYP